MKLDQLSVCLRKCDDLLKGKDQINLAELNMANGSPDVLLKPREGVEGNEESGEAAKTEAGNNGVEDVNGAQEVEGNEKMEVVKKGSDSCETGKKELKAKNGGRDAAAIEPEGRVKRSAAQLASVRLIAALPDRERPKPGPRPPSDIRGKRLSISSSCSSAILESLSVCAKQSRASSPSSIDAQPEAAPDKKLMETACVEPPAKEVTEADAVDSNSRTPKKRGRPKGSKNKPKPKVEANSDSTSVKSENEAPAFRIESWLRQSQSNFGGVIAVRSNPTSPTPVRFTPPGFAMPVHTPKMESSLPVARRSRPSMSPNDWNQAQTSFPGTPVPAEAQQPYQYYADPRNGDSCYVPPEYYASCPPEVPMPKQEVPLYQPEEHSVLNWTWSWNHYNHLPPGNDVQPERNHAEDWFVLEKTKVEDWPIVFAAPEPVVEAPGKVPEEQLAEKPREKFFGVHRVVNPVRVSETEVKCSWCSKVVKKASFRAHVMTWHRKVGIYRKVNEGCTILEVCDRFQCMEAASVHSEDNVNSLVLLISFDPWRRCGICDQGFRLQSEAQLHLKNHENASDLLGKHEETISSLCEDSNMASMDDSCSNFPASMDESAAQFWNCDESSSSNFPEQAALDLDQSTASGVADDSVELNGEVTNSSTFSDDSSRIVDVLDAWMQPAVQREDSVLGMTELLLLEEEGIITPACMFPVVRQVSSMASDDLDASFVSSFDVEGNQESDDVKEYLIIDDSSVNLFTRQFADTACVV